MLMRAPVSAPSDSLNPFETGRGCSYLRCVRPEDRVNVLTITAALDYQTDADRLWQAAVETYLDPATVWLFAMDEVAERDVDLSLDEPLWLLSRDGCSGTDDQDGCARAKECVVAEFCVFQNGGD